jgi:hypothetical protein
MTLLLMSLPLLYEGVRMIATESGFQRIHPDPLFVEVRMNDMHSERQEFHQSRWAGGWLFASNPPWSLRIKRALLLEKLQVLVSAAALAALTYAVLWPFFAPADPEAPMVLLPEGRVFALAMLIVAMLIFAAVAAATTTLSRPGGAMLAALVGLGALSFRSETMRTLLWSYAGNDGTLYLGLLLELLLMAAGLIVAEFLAGLVSGRLNRIPRWPRRIEPLAMLDDDQLRRLDEAEVDTSDLEDADTVTPPSLLHALLAMRKVRGQGKSSDATNSGKALGGAALGTVLGLALVSILLQSHMRGQVIFALGAAFLLAGMVLRQLAGGRWVGLASLMPIIAGPVFYAVGMLNAGRGVNLITWPEPMRVLPIDWLTAGCGGALLGFWMAGRMKEHHIFESLASLEYEEESEG